MTRVHTKHNERIVGKFTVRNSTYNIVNTKHGLYRVLEQKGMQLSDLERIISSIGEDELRHHFDMSRTHFNEQKSWEKQIDYVISVYDVVNKIVLMIGLHPHLNRVTIVTVIPRIFNVISKDVYASYRVDNTDTVETKIQYLIPEDIEMKYIVI